MTRTTQAKAADQETPSEAPEVEQEGPQGSIEVTSLADLAAAIAPDDRPVERVQVHEWPGKPVFYLRGLTGQDRDSIENTTFGEGLNDISAKIVARALATPDGKPLIPRTHKDMAAAELLLTSRTAGGLLHLQRIAKRLSRMDSSAVDELEALLKDVPSS